MNIVNVSLSGNLNDRCSTMFDQYITFDIIIYSVLTTLCDVFGDFYFKIDNKIKFNSKLLVYGIPAGNSTVADGLAMFGVSPTVHIHDPSDLEIYKVLFGENS